MDKLVILDFSVGTVDVFDIAEGAAVDEMYITNMGYNLKNCEWMVGNMDITFHKEVLK